MLASLFAEPALLARHRQALAAVGAGPHQVNELLAAYRPRVPGPLARHPHMKSITDTLTVKDPEEAQRAERDLLESGVPDQDLRLYHAEETLRIASRIQEEQSILAKAIAALVADRPARDRFLSNARAGGSALWIFAPTKDRADRLVGLLADYHYVSMRYYGDDGVEDVHGNVS